MKAESKVKDALLLKEGWRNAGDKATAAIVTAGECGVFLAMANDMRYGIKLTMDEWDQLARFVEDQLIYFRPME